MKLTEYMKRRGGTALTKAEFRELGLEDTSKGWKVRYANLDLPEHVVKRSLNSLLSAAQAKNQKRARNFLSELSTNNNGGSQTGQDHYEKTKLYLMKNVYGLYKIGISIDPYARCKVLSNSAGVPIFIRRVWEVSGINPRRCEAYLHKKFKKHRVIGEWFKLDEVMVSTINQLLSQLEVEYQEVEDNPACLDIIDNTDVSFWLNTR